MTWKNYLPISTVGAFFLLLALRQHGVIPDVGRHHPFRPGEVSLHALCANLEDCKNHATNWDDSVLYLFVPDVDWVPKAVAEFEDYFDRVELQFVDWDPQGEPGHQFSLHGNGVSLWMMCWYPTYLGGLIRHATSDGRPAIHRFGEIWDGDALNHLFSTMNCWATDE